MVVAPFLFLSAKAPRFGQPMPVTANGKVINVDVGHAAPVYADLTGDGVPDLLVGQFGEGKVRLYKNYGTASSPSFKDYRYLEVGGRAATVDFG